MSMGLFNSTKVIRFLPHNEIVPAYQEPPVPAVEKIPEWYKKLSRYVNNTDKPIKAHGMKDLKTCHPFRDSFLTGYLLLTAVDIEIRVSADNDVNVFWNPDLIVNPVEKRGSVLDIKNQGHGMAIPHGCRPEMFAWKGTYGWETDLAYSVIVTHPMNRYDLPFVTTTAVMEPHGMASSGGNIPFFIADGFEGIIPKGTPIAQIIPFKREDWKSEVVDFVKAGSQRDKIYLRDSYLENFYGRFIRQSKNFK
jgi:hypothetical protein